MTPSLESGHTSANWDPVPPRSCPSPVCPCLPAYPPQQFRHRSVDSWKRGWPLRVLPMTALTAVVESPTLRGGARRGGADYPIRVENARLLWLVLLSFLIWFPCLSARVLASWVMDTLLFVRGRPRRFDMDTLLFVCGPPRRLRCLVSAGHCLELVPVSLVAVAGGCARVKKTSCQGMRLPTVRQQRIPAWCAVRSSAAALLYHPVLSAGNRTKVGAHRPCNDRRLPASIFGFLSSPGAVRVLPPSATSPPPRSLETCRWCRCASITAGPCT